MEKQLAFNLFDESDNDIVDYDVVTDDVPKRAKKGDIWQLGRHRLMCGDSTDKETVELLMDGKKADMVFTDPPYGMMLDTDWSGAKSKLQFYQEKRCKAHGNKYDKIIGDNEDFKDELVTTIFDNFGYCK